eukprot:TRINITY_DN5982_c0_g1_i2.p1 TRINITY_DN5982_c0_g1~~TRINITY_DN5982_c0_g1_i2.p1  ORF type:complete len:573 (+),score=61.39 TRINITY_DN5982_c0_g1_i2:55-1719(+)
MRFCLCTDTIIVALGVFSVLVYVFLVLRHHAQTAKRCCALARRCLTPQLKPLRWKHYCVEWFRGDLSSASTAQRKLLERKVLQRRLNGLSNAFAFMTHMSLSLVCLIVVRSLLGNNMLTSASQKACVLVVLWVCMCASYLLTLTPALVEICYGIIMIATSIFMWAAPYDTFVLSGLGTFVVRLVVSVPFVNVRSVLLWNLVALASNSILDSQRHMSEQHMSQQRVRFGTPGDLGVVVALAKAFMIIGAVGFRHWTISSAQQEVDIMNLKMEKSASSALLDLHTDVIVQLDSQLNIDSDSQAFKAFLMKTSGETTKGVPFTRFIAEDHERQNFERQMLAADTASEGRVGTYRTTLSDSLRNRLSADISFVKFEMDVGVSQYLLGIRECRDSDVIDTPAFPAQKYKTVTPSANKGTPSASERAEFKEVIFPSHRSVSEAPSQASASEHLRFSQMTRTGKNAQCDSMQECLSSWNVSVARTTCCSLHAYVMEAKNVLKDLRDSPCAANFPSFETDRMQCQNCGIIEADEEDRACGTCFSRNVNAYEFKPAPPSIVQL